MGYALVFNPDTDEWHIYDAKVREVDSKYVDIIGTHSICSAVEKTSNYFLGFEKRKINITENNSLGNYFKLNEGCMYYYYNKNHCLYFKDIKDIRMFIGIYGNKKICGRCMSKLYSDKNIK